MEEIDRRAMIAGAGALGLVAMARAAAAGTIDPPAGPVGATGKTLQEIYDQVAARRVPISVAATPGDPARLYRITAPGVYYLTADIVPPVGYAGNGIEIAADNVVVDLNGCILGSSALRGAKGIVASGNRRQLTVRNGTVRAWTGTGVDLATTTYARVEHVQSDFNTGSGIVVGAYARVEACIADANQLDNIVSDEHGSLSGCVARGSVTGKGFVVQGFSFLTRCDAVGNALAGVYAPIDGAVTMELCLARSNGSYGFQGYRGTSARECTAWANTNAGFTSCQCVSCHSAKNTDNGFQFCTAHDCRSEENTGYGFLDCYIVSGCRAWGNAEGGLQTSASDNTPCLVTDSNIYGSGGIIANVRGSAYLHGNMLHDSTTQTTGTGVTFESTRLHWADRNMIVNRFGAALTGGGSETVVTGNYIQGTNSIAAAAAMGPIVNNATIEGAAAVNPTANFNP